MLELSQGGWICVRLTVRGSNFEEEPVIGLTLLLSLSEVGDRVRSIRGYFIVNPALECPV